MKPPNNESVACKDFEQLRRGDNETNHNETKRSQTKRIRRGNIDYKRIENMLPLECATKPMKT